VPGPWDTAGSHTWLVEFATGDASGSEPGWPARQVWEHIQPGRAMRGQVWEHTGLEPGWAAGHVWENSQAGQATMREQAPGAAGSWLGEARWIVFNPAQVMLVTEPIGAPAT